MAGLTTSVGQAMAKSISKRGGELDNHDATGLAELIRKKEVSASELLEMSIERAEKANPEFNFMAQKLYDYGRAAIKNGLPEGPLRGVPWLVKDLYTDVAGERTGQGSRSYADYRPKVSSELVRRHQAAGLVIFGKTTTPEFGLSATTESTGYGVTRNPWDKDHITGGSSGGSAAAIAAGIVPAAHATDGGGSVRIPASCCGLFGLKPSRGRVPMGPTRTEGWGGMSVNHALTKSVRDSALIMDVTHGVEPGSRYSAPTPDGTFVSQLEKSLGKLRVAMVLTPPAGTPVDPQCVEATKSAAKLLESLGHVVEEAKLDLDMAAIGQANFAMVSTSLAADIDSRAKITGITPSTDILEKITMIFYGIGKKMDGISVARANDVFQQTSLKMSLFMDKYDIILSPTLASPPLEIGIIDLNHDDMQKWGAAVSGFTPYTGVYNITGQPSMSLPLGMSADGLPIGVMMSGRYGAEATLFCLAAQIEKAQPWWTKMSLALRQS